MQPPEKPDASDCCNSGCNPCIFDIYEQQLKLYEQSLKYPQSIRNETYLNCLSLTAYTFFKLINIQPINTDTSVYIFQHVPRSANSYKLFFKPGQHFLLKNVHVSSINFEETFENETLTRAYTPIPQFNDDTYDETCFRVVIKIYEHGKMSQFIKNLPINAITKWRGPYGNFEIKYSYRNMLCITQGTGFAPIYAVIRQLLDNEDCETRIKLFACFKNIEEILLRREIHWMKSYWNFLATIFLPHEMDLKKASLLYNEDILARRLVESDVDSYFSNIDPNTTQVLVCGSQLFVDTVETFVKKFVGINLFIF